MPLKSLAPVVAVAIVLASALPMQAQVVAPAERARLTAQNASGIQMMVVTEDNDPRLRVVLPDHARGDSSIHILFPEHVTAVKEGSTAAEQLYVFRPGRAGGRPTWRRFGNSLEYERALEGGIELRARATLEDDGVRFHYELTNRSTQAYAMIYAVTDPRLTSLFHDERLERTFVHHADGFDLLASETPARLTLPLSRWLPARYLASHTWPIPANRVELRGDGVTYYNKSRRVDEPFIATRSKDGQWVIASFARDAGNVWSNPALTCQHVDPQTSLASGQQAVLEIKMLILRGSLDDALRRAREQRPSLAAR